MDHFPLWYRQAAEHPVGSFVFNLRSAEAPGNLHLCVLGLSWDQSKLPMGAFGGKQEHTWDRMSILQGPLPTLPHDMLATWKSSFMPYHTIGLYPE